MIDKVQIKSLDYWFKVIEMLQQNWAIIDAPEGGVTVYFVSDTGGVFGQIPFNSVDAAKTHYPRTASSTSAIIQTQRRFSLRRIHRLLYNHTQAVQSIHLVAFGKASKKL